MTDADYWNKLNEDCENRARQASDYCQRCWGYGGSEAPWQMYVHLSFLSPFSGLLDKEEADITGDNSQIG